MNKFKRDEQQFDMIPSVVRRGLRQCTKSITEIEQERKRIFHGDVEQRRFKERHVWNSKKDIDAFVVEELGLDVNSYGKAEQRIFYQRVVNVITKMREGGELVDWRYTNHMRRGPRYGIWRLAEPTEARAITEFRDEDYSSHPARSIVAKRAKQGQFRIRLLASFRHCLFCKFRLDPYLQAAHIVPFNVMQRDEPHNSMNPANGLLLCMLCHEAFDTGHITVDEDYNIQHNIDLASSLLGAAGDCWISNIDERLRIRKLSDLKPDPRYLGWKIRLAET